MLLRLNNYSRVNIKSAVSELSSTSASFRFASSNGRVTDSTSTTNATATNGSTSTTSSIDEITKRKLLAEEEAMYEKLKVLHFIFFNLYFWESI